MEQRNIFNICTDRSGGPFKSVLEINFRAASAFVLLDGDRDGGPFYSPKWKKQLLTKHPRSIEKNVYFLNPYKLGPIDSIAASFSWWILIVLSKIGFSQMCVRAKLQDKHYTREHLFLESY